MSLIDDAYALIAPQGRSIGFIIPGVVVEEIHSDQTGITLHPVEIGAAITDHAFQLPARVEMRIGWSDSSAGEVGFSREAYQALLQLKAMREPFTVQTGKRAYRNMLIQALTTANDHKTENALLISVVLQEVLLAQARGGGSGGGGQAPNGAMTDPQRTGSLFEGGTVQALDTGRLIPGGLSVGGLSDNAIQFGNNLGGTGSFVGNTPGDGAFGLGGPFGDPQF